ncbi:hypothetical protein [Bdellovibrio sp. HCB337]|uniref:hypothetical protein n=1 Tax=Bdellovibrio sp. HCB337 TaxID=3394358 RepID=UPI0039A66E9D
MKSILVLSTLLASSICMARPNMVCLYGNSAQGWESAGALFSYIEYDAQRYFGTVAISLYDYNSTNAICTRDTDAMHGSGHVFDQAHYMITSGGEGPDPATCEVPASSTYTTVKRQKAILAPGESTEISMADTKVIHYLMTDADVLELESIEEAKMGQLLNEKCLALLPGSIKSQNPEKLLQRAKVRWNLK